MGKFPIYGKYGFLIKQGVFKMKNGIKTVGAWMLILCTIAVGMAATACNKKGDDQSAEIAALARQLNEMQAKLEAAKSANASPEEIARLEAAVAEAAQQEIAAQRTTTAPATQTATPAQTAAAINAQMMEEAKKQNFSDDDIKKTEKTMEKMMADAAVQIAQLEAAQIAAQIAARNAEQDQFAFAAAPAASQTPAATPAASTAPASQRSNSATSRNPETIAARQQETREQIQQLNAERRARIEQETGMPYEEYLRIESAKQYAQEVVEREAAVKIRLTKEQKDAMVAKGQGVLTVGWATARPGEQVTLSFNLVHPGLAAFSVHIGYDTWILRIDSEDEVKFRFGNGALRNVMFAFKSQFPQTVPYEPGVFWAGAANDYSVGELVTVRFTVLPDVTPTPRWAHIKVSVFDSGDQNLVKVPITIEQGGITIR